MQSSTKRPQAAFVVTTIQNPTTSMRRLAELAGRNETPIIVVGDRKGPTEWVLQGTELLTLADQYELPLSLARLLPENHYCRKNVGYLSAWKLGVDWVFETDDDNHPTSGWSPQMTRIDCDVFDACDNWINIYGLFEPNVEPIWPRGLPLAEVPRDVQPTCTHAGVYAPIHQLLADGAPDVDAVWRMIYGSPVVRFLRRAPAALAPLTWSPFNSQATWWHRDVAPLMYLPATCSFRMTDIWRSLVAQRCLWELDGSVVFHGPEVYQDRNTHSLTNDFRDEVDGYLHNDDIRRILQQANLSPGINALDDNIQTCYALLVTEGFVADSELSLLAAWLDDFNLIGEK